MLCHATGFNATTYRPLAQSFVEHFDVWGLDFRAHGQSTPPANDEFDWTNMADDVLAVVDYMGVSAMNGFGHSMGAAALMIAAAKRPELIASAWIYEPIIFPPDLVPHNSTLAEGARKRRSVFPSKAEALARYASRPPFGWVRADALAAYVDGGFIEQADGTVTLACTGAHEAMTFERAGTPVSDIATVAAPVAVAAGLDTPLADHPGTWSPAIADALPNGTYVEYAEYGHFGPLQDPRIIARDAIEFFAAVS